MVHTVGSLCDGLIRTDSRSMKEDTFGIKEPSTMRTKNAHPVAHRPEWYPGCAFFPLLYTHYGVGEFAHPLYSSEAVRKFPLYSGGRCANYLCTVLAVRISPLYLSPPELS